MLLNTVAQNEKILIEISAYSRNSRIQCFHLLRDTNDFIIIATTIPMRTDEKMQAKYKQNSNKISLLYNISI